VTQGARRVGRRIDGRDVERPSDRVGARDLADVARMLREVHSAAPIETSADRRVGNLILGAALTLDTLATVES
jgi:hypothetical protein